MTQFSFKSMPLHFLNLSLLVSTLIMTSCGKSAKKTIDHKDPIIASKIRFMPSGASIVLNESESSSLVILFNKPTEVLTQIDWTITGGESDFEYASGTTQLPIGESSTSFTLRGTLDNLRELPEEFQLFIGSPDAHVEGSLTIPITLHNLTSSAELRIVEGNAIDFSTLALQDLRSQVLTIQNNGQAEASLALAPSLPLPFSFLGGTYPGSGGTCSLKLDGHSTCTMVLAYSPLEAGTNAYSLLLGYTDGIDSHPLSVQLSGQGVGIVPTLSGTPIGRNNTTALNISVSGDQVVQFKYKVGVSIDCSLISNYSAALNPSALISDSIATLPDGEIKVCVIGKNGQNVWQSTLTAISSSWIKDTTAPTITGLADDLSWTQTKTPTWGCSGDDTCTYRFLVDQNATTDLSLLSYATGTTTTIPSGNGNHYLHIQALDSVGYESAVIDILYHLDNTDPNPPTNLVDGDYKASLTLSPTITWTAATDGLSAIANYEYALGSAFGLSDVKDWTALNTTDTTITLSGLNLIADTYYFPSIRAVDSAGNRSSVLSGDGWLVDVTNPTPPVLVNDGFIVSSLTTSSINWSAGSDGQSGIASYQVAVGTTPSGNDILDWTDVGQALSTTQNVTLAQAGTYYGSVRVLDNAGNISVPRSGDGWIATGQFSTLARLADFSNPPTVRSVSEGNFLGQAVAVSEDGLTAVIGAPLDDLDSAGANFIENAGAAYVFVKSGSDWIFQQKLIATGTNARMSNDQFGSSLSVSGDTIVVGTPYQDYNEIGGGVLTNTGAAFVFTRNIATGIWSQQAKLTPTGTNARVTSDQFGWAVTLSGDSVAVAAPWQDFDDYGNASIADSGAVFIFTRNPATGVWAQEQKVVAQGAYARQASDFFGYSVSLNNNTLIAGAYGQDYDSTGGSGTYLATAGAAFVYVRSGVTWSQQARITPTGTTERVAGDQFGIAVTVSGDTVAIGSNYQGYDESGLNLVSRAGAAYVYIRNPALGTWSLQQKLVGTGASNARRANDYFGQALSLSQNTLSVGAPMQDYDAAGAAAVTDAGATFVFTRNVGTGVWSLEQKIVGQGTNGRLSNDQYGGAVAVGTDTLLAGARYHDYETTGTTWVVDAGAAFLQTRSGTIWTLIARLTDNTVPSINRAGSINSAYGSSVAVSEDQSLLVIGAPASNVDSTNGNYQTDAGVVYVYVKQSETWILQQKLSPTGLNARWASDSFGTSVSISGNTLVVGAPGQDYDEVGANLISGAGAAYVFVQDGNGVWNQQAKLTASGLNARLASDGFGTSVAIRGDRIAIGSPLQNYDSTGGNAISDAGALFLFHRSGANWTQDYRLVAPTSSGRAANDQLGFSLAISSDGSYLATGAPNQDTDSNGLNSIVDGGAVYVYKKLTDDSWVFSQKLVAVGTNARVTTDRFGYSLAMDSQRIAIGVPYQDYNESGSTAIADAGAIYVFYRSTSNYTQEQKLVGSSSMVNSRVASDTLGFSVAIAGDVLVAGSPGQDYDANGATSLSASGAAYVFVRSSGLWAHQQRLTGFGPSSRLASDEFGRAVALSGIQLVIGARYNDYDSNGTNYFPNSGAAFTFVF